MMFSKRLRLLLSCMLVLSLLVGGCSSQSTEKNESDTNDGSSAEGGYTYMLPFDPGGQSDVAARRQQKRLEKELGSSVTITYKAGGGGALGWSQLVKKKPNGHYMAGINLPHIVVQPLTRKNAGYKTSQIDPVAIFQATPIGLAVQKDSGIESLKDLVAEAKKSPGSITVSGSGEYTGHHMAFLQFENLTGIKMTYIPFSGAAPSVKNFLGHHTDAILANSDDLLKYKDDMNILAIGTEKRFKPLSNVPTFKEQGLNMTPGIQRGIAVPPGTSKKSKEKLESAFLKVVGKSGFQKRMYKDGFQPMDLGSKESEKYIQNKKEEYSDILKKLGLPKEKN